MTRHPSGTRRASIAWPSSTVAASVRISSEARSYPLLWSGGVSYGEDIGEVAHGPAGVSRFAATFQDRGRHQQGPLLIGQVTWEQHAPHGDHVLQPCNGDTHSQDPDDGRGGLAASGAPVASCGSFRAKVSEAPSSNCARWPDRSGRRAACAGGCSCARGELAVRTRQIPRFQPSNRGQAAHRRR